MRQDLLLDEVVVQGFEKLAEKLHHAAIELAEHDAALAGVQIEHGDGLAQHPAQLARTDGQALGVERGTTGHHAQALAQKKQRQAVADFRPRGDFTQRHGFIHRLRIDQGQRRERRRRGLRHVGLHRFGQACQGLLDPFEHGRSKVGAIGADALARFQQGTLHLVAAGVLGTAEQLLLELVEH
ncbi:MAG TPA: hypothetical protein PLH21_03030 [Chiayiivirga sp.]|nr:hypothetical protein [Chiayiivirga sp.]